MKRRRNVTIAASTNCESKTAEIEVSVVDKLTAGLDVTQEGTVYGGTALKAPSYHISGGTEAPGSTETPDAGKKPAAKGTVLVDAGKTAAYVVTSADAKHPTIAYKKCRNKKAKTVTIPKTVKIGGVTYTVTSIAASAFKNHKTLTKVTIGDSIKTIGKNAFYGCKKLKTVTIGKNVTKIGAGAFSGCKKLVAVKMGSKVSVIGDEAVYT